MGKAKSRRDKKAAGRWIINSPKLGPREPRYWDNCERIHILGSPKNTSIPAIL
jgi:hypothetical protein